MIDREKEELFKKIYQLQIGPNKEDRMFVLDKNGEKVNNLRLPLKKGMRISLDTRTNPGPKFSIKGAVEKRMIGNTIREILGQNVKTKFNVKDVYPTYKE